MSPFTRRPALRWLVPATAAALLIGGVSAAGVLTANAGDPLPQRTPSQLLIDVQNARLTGLSGTIVEDADLGLPDLPGVGQTQVRVLDDGAGQSRETGVLHVDEEL